MIPEIEEVDVMKASGNSQVTLAHDDAKKDRHQGGQSIPPRHGPQSFRHGPTGRVSESDARYMNGPDVSAMEDP